MADTTRKMILATFIHNSGAHPAGWRFGGNEPFDTHDIKAWANAVKIAERGKFHCYFSGDQQGFPNLKGKDAYAGTDNAGKLEPMTLLAALATLTSDIGLIATASTSFNEPYALARRFASIDHISGGRAGWNVVTSAGNQEAQNFGMQTLPPHDERYDRAEEFVDVVKALWDSWEDGAILRDREAGRYFDPAKLHQLRHEGKYFKVAGPLNIARPPQGHPIIVQAGGSEVGRNLSARTADLIFTAQNSLEAAQEFYRDTKERAARFGRDPNHVLVLPSVQLMVRSTEAEAKMAAEELVSLIPQPLAKSTLGMQLGCDLTDYSTDDLLPDIPMTNGGQWVQQQIIKMARDGRLTIGDLARRVAVSRASYAQAGTPEQIADFCEEWFHNGAADGISLSPNYMPGSLEDFVDQVVPILQKRGSFRTEYEGATLRENLGLPRPENSFISNPALGSEPDIWQ